MEWVHEVGLAALREIFEANATAIAGPKGSTWPNGRGRSKNAASLHLVEWMGAKMRDYFSRPLFHLKLLVLMVDEIMVAGQTAVVALGITEDGTKEPLGLWQGSMENAALCISLFQDLIGRAGRPDSLCERPQPQRSESPAQAEHRPDAGFEVDVAETDAVRQDEAPGPPDVLVDAGVGPVALRPAHAREVRPPAALRPVQAQPHSECPRRIVVSDPDSAERGQVVPEVQLETRAEERRPVRQAGADAGLPGRPRRRRHEQEEDEAERTHHAVWLRSGCARRARSSGSS